MDLQRGDDQDVVGYRFEAVREQREDIEDSLPLQLVVEVIAGPKRVKDIEQDLRALKIWNN